MIERKFETLLTQYGKAIQNLAACNPADHDHVAAKAVRAKAILRSFLKDELEAARATAEQSVPYGYVYEWDCSPGVVHRDFGYGTYNGRYPDRTVTVYAALKSQQDAAISATEKTS